MATEDFLINYRGHWEAVEAVGEGFPQFDIVAPFTFVVKSINSVDGRTLVITSQQEKVFGVFDLVREQ